MQRIRGRGRGGEETLARWFFVCFTNIEMQCKVSVLKYETQLQDFAQPNRGADVETWKLFIKY